MELKTTINGYKVSLDTGMDGDGETTGCWIQKDGHSASLECADATGALQDSNDHELPIGATTVAAIRRWAEKNGY